MESKSKDISFFIFFFVIFGAIVCQNIQASDSNKSELREWASILEKKIKLCERDISQGTLECDVSVPWENRIVSIAEAKNLVEQYLLEAQKLEELANYSWQGMWTDKEKESVVNTIKSLKDKKIRDWFSTKECKRMRDPGQQKLSPWAGRSGLVFADEFFNPKRSTASKINVTAYEAGKVLWFEKENKTLEEWWQSYYDKYSSVIFKMKTTKYPADQGEDISYIFDPPGQRGSGFGHLFRALALGLKWETPKGQEAKKEFENRVYQLLQN